MQALNNVMEILFISLAMLHSLVWIIIAPNPVISSNGRNIAIIAIFHIKLKPQPCSYEFQSGLSFASPIFP